MILTLFLFLFENTDSLYIVSHLLLGYFFPRVYSPHLSRSLVTAEKEQFRYCVQGTVWFTKEMPGGTWVALLGASNS